MHLKSPSAHQPRIKLTEGMLNRFFKNIFQGKISELSMNRGLSYTLVYNLVHGRIQTLSARDYRIIFGEDPPFQENERVDGEYFRGMVRLWLFFNKEISEADLYREFYPHKKVTRVDYRIFTGDVKTVPMRLEKDMEQKFFDHGFDLTEIKQYIEELDITDYNDRVLYDDIRPVLGYLNQSLDVHPSRILNQFSLRYESGELATVSKEVYDHALRLKEKTEKVLESGSKAEIEKLKEGIYGKRTGLTLFSAVEEDLEFLKNHGGRRPKHYLGRSISLYKNAKLKRIASWRAQKIRNDCHKLLRQETDVSISSIPKPYLKGIFENLLFVLTTRIISRLVGEKGKKFERSILKPTSLYKADYKGDTRRITSMNKAAHVLGMSREAFDLMVAEHRAMFRGIVIYNQEWYLPDGYLNEILKKEGFRVIKVKYECWAKNGKNPSRSLYPSTPQSRNQGLPYPA